MNSISASGQEKVPVRVNDGITLSVPSVRGSSAGFQFFFEVAEM